MGRSTQGFVWKPAVRNPDAVLAQLWRYTLVSGVAVAADFGAFLALSLAGVRPAPAGAIGYAAGMLVHYLLSSRFVFDATRSAKSEQRQMAGFVLSGLAGLTSTFLIIAVATEAFGVGPVNAKAIAVIVSFLAVFAIRRTFVFSPAGAANKTNAEALVYAKSASSS
jgi:putative flippase GtrA